MQIRTALIVDPCEEVCLALAEALEPDFRVLCCGDGLAALELLDSEQPELLILELSLPRLDGIGLLRRIACRDFLPRILVNTGNRTDYVLSVLQDLPVAYAMRKPTDARLVAERARELLLPRCADPLAWEVSDLLLRLSIPNPSQGHRHLMTGLPLLAEQPDQFLGKTFYAEIARRNGATCNSVEKAIRDAIHGGWEQGDRRVWQRYFPGISRCPQNKPFLTRLASLLQRQLKCG